MLCLLPLEANGRFLVLEVRALLRLEQKLVDELQFWSMSCVNLGKPDFKGQNLSHQCRLYTCSPEHITKTG